MTVYVFHNGTSHEIRDVERINVNEGIIAFWVGDGDAQLIRLAIHIDKLEYYFIKEEQA